MTLDPIITTIIARGDLAHLALFLWACGASALVVSVLRDLARSIGEMEPKLERVAEALRRMGGDV